MATSFFPPNYNMLSKLAAALGLEMPLQKIVIECSYDEVTRVYAKGLLEEKSVQGLCDAIRIIPVADVTVDGKGNVAPVQIRKPETEMAPDSVPWTNCETGRDSRGKVHALTRAERQGIKHISPVCQVFGRQKIVASMLLDNTVLPTCEECCRVVKLIGP